MNWNAGVGASNSHQLNSSNGAFSFHAPNHDPYKSDDSYQTVDEDDDDEYEPISLAGWGDNATTSASQAEPASWNNLIDHSIKVKEGGVGSGNLHRRGGNFIPLSEDRILAQRLNKPIPGKKLPSSKSRGGKKKKPKAASLTRPPPFSRPIARVTPHVPPARQQSANAPPSPWGTIPLVETPFWEKNTVQPPAPVQSRVPAPIPARNIAPMPTRNIAPVRVPARSSSPIPVLCETPFWEVKKEPVTPVKEPIPAALVNAPEPIVAVKAKAPTTPVPTITPAKWSPQAQGFQPIAAPLFNPGVPSVAVFNPEVPAFNPVPKANKLDFNPTVPSFNPTSLSVNPAFNPNSHEILPFVTLPSKTPVKITSPVESKRYTSNVVDTMNNLSMETQTGPESTRGLEEPKAILQLTLEIAVGISTEILVYEDSEPRQVAEDFARKHVLNMTNTAKSSLANTIRIIMDAKLAN